MKITEIKKRPFINETIITLIKDVFCDAKLIVDIQLNGYNIARKYSDAICETESSKDSMTKILVKECNKFKGPFIKIENDVLVFAHIGYLKIEYGKHISTLEEISNACAPYVIDYFIYNNLEGDNVLASEEVHNLVKGTQNDLHSQSG